MLAELLQQRAPAAGQGPPPGVFAFLALLYGGACVFIVVILVLQILLYLTLMKTLEQCAPRNRTMEPGMVWLNFVPFLNLVWIFLTVIRVSESLRNEYEDRGLDGDDDYGQTMGLVHAIGAVVCGVSALVTIFLYRAKISQYRDELEQSRPRRRRRPRRDDRDLDDDRDERRDRDDDGY